MLLLSADLMCLSFFMLRLVYIEIKEGLENFD